MLLFTKRFFWLPCLFFAASAFAYQPKLVEGNDIIVREPEVSKAYFSQPQGKPQVYRINAKAPFDLYVNLLVPDMADQQKDLTVVITKTGHAEPVATLEGSQFAWKQSFESRSRNSYWRGPEYQAKAEAGDYEIRVSSPRNDTKYVLVIGKVDIFDLKEAIEEMEIIPTIKREFFDQSPAIFLLSPLGIVYIVGMFFFSFIFGLSYRFLCGHFLKGTPNAAPKNIDMQGRLIRLGIGIALFIWAVVISWSPIALFFAGFCFFEAIFSWCGLYAALGKNSCPL